MRTIASWLLNMTLDLDWMTIDPCWKVEKLSTVCPPPLVPTNTHTVKIYVRISQYVPAQFSFVWKVHNFQCTWCCFTSWACAYQSWCKNQADNTLIVLSFPALCVSLFFRYKDIAGSLENAISDGLEAALGRKLSLIMNIRVYQTLLPAVTVYLPVHVQLAVHTTCRCLRFCGPV